MSFNRILFNILIIITFAIISCIIFLFIYPVEYNPYITLHNESPTIYIPSHLKKNVLHYGSFKNTTSLDEAWFFLQPTLEERGGVFKKYFILAGPPMEEEDKTNLLLTISDYTQEAFLVYPDRKVITMNSIEDILPLVINGSGKAFLLITDMIPPLRLESINPVYYKLHREIDNPIYLVLSYFLKNPVFIKESEPSLTKLSFVGDIMLSRGVGLKIKENGLDYPFMHVKSFLKEADILFGNLESLISDKGNRANQLITFRAKPETINILINSDFTVMSTANNHALDYGKTALLDSLDRLKTSGIEPIGAGKNFEEASKFVIIEKNDVKVGFLAYNEVPPAGLSATINTPGVNFLEKERAIREVRELDKKVDILVVSLHWGLEYTHEPTSKQIELTHQLLREGVDLIIGHHPHVLQPINVVEGKIVAYSLGNFLFDQNFSEETSTGGILTVLVHDSRLISLEFKPTFIKKEQLLWIKESIKVSNIRKILKFNIFKDFYSP